MNKGKILKITENTVYIGYEDGSLKEIPIESFLILNLVTLNLEWGIM